ncbi:MAG: YgaP family membrane protein [Ramlibacter sp.]
MTINQVVRLFAGIVILVSLALGAPGSPLFVSTWWLALTAFVGFNLAQSSLTHICPLESVLRKLGVRGGC